MWLRKTVLMAYIQYPRNRLGTCELLLIGLFPATHFTSTRGRNLNLYVVTVCPSIVTPSPSALAQAMCTHQPVLYPGCSRNEVLEPSATTTLLTHDDWPMLISFTVSVMGMHHQRVKNTVVGSPSVLIQAEKYLATCYVSGCETCDHLPQVPWNGAYNLLMITKRYCEKSDAV
jgi:hypothetical protein